MTKDSMSSLYDDSPRSDPETEDELGYKRFAERVAEALAGIDAPNGYVIGLHGRWGSGKSTVLNFVKYYLKKLDKAGLPGARDMLRVDFAPWIISGHDDVVSAFFKILGEAIAEPEDRRSGRLKRVVRWFRKDTDRTIDAIAKIGVIADPSGGLLSGVGSVVAKRSLGAAMDQWLSEPTLQAAYEALVRKLRQRCGKIVVFIDDIDRLTGEEIRTIMQMVKSVGRLPNVIYVLSYDRSIVWGALDDLSARNDGDPSYGEKIVQLELDLPVPNRAKLLRILDREVGPLIRKSPNNFRWHILLTEGLQRWIKLPRDVVRISNAAKFVWPGLRDEVDSQDLLIMEGMRLFDPDLFAWVRTNRDFLLRQGRWQIVQDTDHKAFGRRFLDTLGAERQDRVEVLCTLFPGIRQHLSERTFVADDPYSTLLVKRRIAVPSAYDAYFSLFPLEDALAKAELDAFVAHFADQPYMESVARELAERRSGDGGSMVGDLLEQVRYVLKTDPAVRPTEQLLRALFEVGDEILGLNDDRMLVLGAGAQLSSLVKDVVAGIGDEAARPILLDIFSKTESVAFSADFWVDRGRELRVFKDEGSTREGPLSMETFEALGPSLKELIERKVDSGEVVAAPVYFDILRSWAKLASPQVARDWVSKTSLSDGHVLAKVAFGLLSYSSGEGGGREYFYRRDPVSELYDLDVLLEASEIWAGSADLDQEEQARVLALRDGLRRRKAGDTSDEW